MSSAAEDVRNLTVNSCNFEEGDTFTEYWERFSFRTIKPAEYLLSSHPSTPGSSKHGEVLFKEVAHLRAVDDFDKTKVTELLFFVRDKISRVSAEIHNVHKPTFNSVFVECAQFVKSLIDFFESSGDDALARFPKQAMKYLSYRGKAMVGRFISCSSLFHDRMYEELEKFKHNQLKVYQDMADSIWVKVERECTILKNHMSIINFLLETFEKNKRVPEKIQEEAFNAIEQASAKAMYSILFLASESSRVIRNSFELIEVTIDMINAVLKDVTEFCSAVEQDSSCQLGSPDLFKGGFWMILIDEFLELPPEIEDMLTNTKSQTSVHILCENSADLEKSFLKKKSNTSLLKWYEQISGYLGDEARILPVNRIFASGLERMTKKVKLGECLVKYVELENEDIKMIEEFNYKVRINKGRIPVNGDLCLSKEFMIFYGSTMGIKLDLLIPYECIESFSPILNFFGQNNGLKIQTVSGKLELFFNDNDASMQAASRIGFSREIMFAAMMSSLGQMLTYREEFFWGKQGHFAVQEISQLPEYLIRHAFKRLTKIRRQINLKDVHARWLTDQLVIGNCNVHKLIYLLFMGIGINSPSKAMIDKWKADNGIYIVDQPIQYKLPAFLKKLWVKDQIECVYEDVEGIVCVNLVKDKDGHMWTENIVIHYSHPDQVVVQVNLSDELNIDQTDYLWIVKQISEIQVKIISLHTQGNNTEMAEKLYGFRFLTWLNQSFSSRALPNKNEIILKDLNYKEMRPEIERKEATLEDLDLNKPIKINIEDLCLDEPVRQTSKVHEQVRCIPETAQRETILEHATHQAVNFAQGMIYAINNIDQDMTISNSVNQSDITYRPLDIEPMSTMDDSCHTFDIDDARHVYDMLVDLCHGHDRPVLEYNDRDVKHASELQNYLSEVLQSIVMDTPLNEKADPVIERTICEPLDNCQTLESLYIHKIHEYRHPSCFTIASTVFTSYLHIYNPPSESSVVYQHTDQVCYTVPLSCMTLNMCVVSMTLDCYYVYAPLKSVFVDCYSEFKEIEWAFIKKVYSSCIIEPSEAIESTIDSQWIPRVYNLVRIGPSKHLSKTTATNYIHRIHQLAKTPEASTMTLSTDYLIHIHPILTLPIPPHTHTHKPRHSISPSCDTAGEVVRCKRNDTVNVEECTRVVVIEDRIMMTDACMLYMTFEHTYVDVIHKYTSLAVSEACMGIIECCVYIEPAGMMRAEMDSMMDMMIDTMYWTIPLIDIMTCEVIFVYAIIENCYHNDVIDIVRADISDVCDKSLEYGYLGAPDKSKCYGPKFIFCVLEVQIFVFPVDVVGLEEPCVGFKAIECCNYVVPLAKIQINPIEIICSSADTTHFKKLTRLPKSNPTKPVMETPMMQTALDLIKGYQLKVSETPSKIPKSPFRR